MKNFVIVGSLLLSTVTVVAQTAPKEFTFKITEPEIKIISDGLLTQPLGLAGPLVGKLQKQFIDQQPKPEKVEEKKSEGEKPKPGKK